MLSLEGKAILDGRREICPKKPVRRARAISMAVAHLYTTTEQFPSHCLLGEKAYAAPHQCWDFISERPTVFPAADHKVLRG